MSLTVEEGKYSLDMQNLNMTIKSLEYPPHKPVFTKTNVGSVAVQKGNHLEVHPMEVNMPYIEMISE